MISGNDDSISFGVTELFRAFHITNEDGLTLLQPEDIPNGQENSIQTSAPFRKTF